MMGFEPEKLMQKQTIPWDDIRAQRVYAGVKDASRKKSRLTVFKVGMAATFILGIIAGILVLFVWKSDMATTPMKAGSPPTKTGDGASTEETMSAAEEKTSPVELPFSGIAYLKTGAAFDIETADENQLKIIHKKGTITYEFEKNVTLRKMVVAGPVTIHVIGTIFEVVKDESHVAVSVMRGQVWVAAPDREMTLKQGDVVRLAVADGPVSTVPADTENKREGYVPQTSAKRAARIAPDQKESKSKVRDANASVPESIDDFLASADQARKNGDLRTAASILRETIGKFGDHPRVATLWFTLGNVEQSRSRPDAAAAAYRQCYRAAPNAPLAADALAQAALNWQRTSRLDDATAAAREYINHFPDGLLAAHMKRILNFADE